MIDNIWFYSLLPASVAFYCLTVLFRSVSVGSDISYIKLFTNLMLMNVLQAVGYIMFAFAPIYAEYIADLYLISTYFFFIHLLQIALALTKTPIDSRYSNLLYLLPAALSVMHCFGLIVEGYRVEQNTLMHNDGDFSWCADIFALVSCIATVMLLKRNVKATSDDRILMSKNMLALLSFAPLILAAFVLAALSMTEYVISVTIIGPLVAFYTALVFFYISKKNIVDLSIGLRFFKARLRLAILLLETENNKKATGHFKEKMEKQFVLEALDRNNHKIQITADYLGINHTTLRKKIKDYNLELE